MNSALETVNSRILMGDLGGFQMKEVSSMSLGSERNQGWGSLIIIQIIKVMRTDDTIQVEGLSMIRTKV